jgi:S1-C subfamily serine protease
MLEVDGKAVSSVADFNKSIKEAKENKVVRLKIQRGNAKIFLGAPLG